MITADERMRLFVRARQSISSIANGLGCSPDTGKEDTFVFFAEHIESLEIERAFLDDQPFFLVKVRFRRCMFFRRGDEKFGILVDSVADLGPFQNWLLANEVKARVELNA
jgi:hypothetical protein